MTMMEPESTPDRARLETGAARYDHLREVTRDDIVNALALLRGQQRQHTLIALRSLFSLQGDDVQSLHADLALLGRKVPDGERVGVLRRRASCRIDGGPVSVTSSNPCRFHSNRRK
jgi:hypothetical protein